MDTLRGIDEDRLDLDHDTADEPDRAELDVDDNEL